MESTAGDAKAPTKKPGESLDALLERSITSVWRSTYKKTRPCYEIAVILTCEADNELVRAVNQISQWGALEWPTPSSFRFSFDYASVNTPERIDRAVRTAVKDFYLRPKLL